MVSPVRERVLVQGLRRFGFEGPKAGGKHLQMIKEGKTLTIPNHRGSKNGGDLPVPLIKQVLKRAGIPIEDWDARA